MLKNKQHHTKALINHSFRLVTNLQYGLNHRYSLYVTKSFPVYSKFTSNAF